MYPGSPLPACRYLPRSLLLYSENNLWLSNTLQLRHGPSCHLGPPIYVAGITQVRAYLDCSSSYFCKVFIIL